MGKQIRLKHKIASIPYVPGSFATYDLPRDYDYETLFIRISGTVNVTEAADDVRYEAPCQLIQRVEVIADGKNTVHSVPFHALNFGNRERFSFEALDQIISAPNSSAVGSYAVRATGALDFATISGIRPKDSNFRSAGLSLFQLRFTFGQPGDIFIGGEATAGTIFIEVWAYKTMELADAKGEMSAPLCLKKTSYQEQTITGANPNMEIRLPAGNQIASVLIRTEDAAGEPTHEVLNNVKLVSGQDVRANLDAQSIIDDSAMAYGQVPYGYYPLSIVEQGPSRTVLADLWDVSGVAEPKVILDVANVPGAKVQVIVTEYIFASV